ncbi:putative lipid II flippase FtsW [Alicyclobacillus acidiphilus]|uniref:putative lipid II flippase FtsW n=1 Tax=Alicyclobacillus acidiphilus TaxID=182455 RepID=UPI000AD6D420|nr:putative lipid II flippase FtsW [Alicyclobacillus acidiphilus]
MRAERHQPDYILMITVLMLTGIGIVTVYSASMVYDLHHGLSPDHYAIRQLFAAIVGLLAFAGLTFVPYEFWYRNAPKALAVSIFLLVVVMLPGVGHRSQGATRWIGSSSFHVQPSEIALVAVIIYLAFLLTKKLPVIHNTSRAFRPAIVVVFLATLLVFAEPDMGTAMALFGSSIVLLFASGLRIRPIVITLGVTMALAYLAGHFSYRASRLTSFMHPFKEAKGSGYQLIQGLTAIAGGGWTGRGFASSIAATGYLPESYTDFIFAVFTEEWGWLGDIGLLAIFGVLIWRGFHIARYARDRFGAMLAIGLTSTIIIQAVINLGAVTWLLPVTGIPLPFISYGGTDVAINLAAMGILMSISRQTADEMPREDVIADIISVDEIRAERDASASASTARLPRRPAKVASLTTRRGREPQRQAKERRDVGSGSWSRGRDETAATSVRRTISLTWRAQQEQQQRDRTRDSRDAKGGRGKKSPKKR